MTKEEYAKAPTDKAFRPRPSAAPDPSKIASSVLGPHMTKHVGLLWGGSSQILTNLKGSKTTAVTFCQDAASTSHRDHHM